MSDYYKKREQALEACEKVINGIEDGNISVEASLLLCKKIARLVNDPEGIEWLGYEYGGYPRDKEGRILSGAWSIAEEHGRSIPAKEKDGKNYKSIFIELCSELEASIASNHKALSNYTTQGFSTAGDGAIASTSNMIAGVSAHTNDILNSIKTAGRRLAILKSEYYDYAVKWQIELQFGHAAKSIFDEYQEKVEKYSSLLPTTTLQKLNAIEDLIEDGNPERYAQVLASCRRLWIDVAKHLFSKVLPNYSEKTFRTKTGKDIDVSGDHYNNMLSAVIETLQSKAAKNTLVGSETIYLIDWMEQINDTQNEGVHGSVTREQAIQCIIHTYIALGDILSLKADVDYAKQE